MSRPPGGGRPVAAADAVAERQRWVATREERIAALRRVDVRAATAIVEAAGGADGDGKDEPDLAAPPWRRGRGGTALGRAVHAVLQSVDFDTGSGCAEIARAQAAAEGISDSAATVARLAEAALSSAVVREAVASGRYWRELYVAAPVGSTIVEGFVDLAYDRGDGGLVIVDYKTDAVRSDADIDTAVRRYRLQLATYALALEALGQPVVAGVLLFVGGGVARARTIDDIAVAAAEVRQLLGGA
jgi:ATP-dependent helicase/nuclease subunit A